MRISFLVGLLLLSGSVVRAQRAAPNLTGQWAGPLRIPTGATLQLRLNVADAAGRAATLDILNQNAKGIPVDRVEARQDSVLLTISAIKASFAGRVAAGGQQWQGVWRQKGARLPLTLQRTAAAPTPVLATTPRGAKPNRPQEPVAPFPYRAEEVQFLNKGANVRLAGTLTLPPGQGPFPAAVLLTGSGPQDRDETIYNHKPFLLIADYLTRRGIAVLRFDDRGAGKSGGDAKAMTAAIYATDAEAALQFLRARPEINGKEVGLIGHSEGGTAGIRAAATAPGAAFLVLLGTAGLPGGEVVVQQALANARMKTTDPKILAGVEQRQRTMLAITQRVTDPQLAQQQMVTVLMPNISLPPEQMAQLRAAAAGQASLFITPSFRYLLTDNPTQTLRAVKCPVLALGGSKDMQVVSNTNLPALDKALKASGNRDVTVRELPGLNHMFQTAPTGGLDEYGRIEETFSPAALQAMGDWLAKRVR